MMLSVYIKSNNLKVLVYHVTNKLITILNREVPVIILSRELKVFAILAGCTAS